MVVHNLKIRPATADDNSILAEFGAQAFLDSFAADNQPEDMAAYIASAFHPEIQAAELADPSSVFLMAEVGNETAGYARLSESQPPASVAGK